MSTPAARIAPCLLTLPMALFAAACGGDETDAAGRGSVAEETPPPSGIAPRSFERSEAPEVRELRAAIDLLDLERTDELLEKVAPTLPVEGDLLRARGLAMRGRDLEVGQRIEAARAAGPTDPRVFATAAELHASAGRFETARDELRRGVEECGLSPELLRAQGVLQLCQQGGAERGLELLTRALQLDPGLPFTARALGQAHLLLGKRALGEKRPRAALASAEEAVRHDPRDVDIRVFLADCLAACADFPAAVAILEELSEEGYDRRGELASMYKKAAIGELLEHHRDRAIDYFAKAREAGLSDEELGSGADILRDEALAAMSEGIAAYEAQDLDRARERFEHGLALDPGVLALRNHLAVVLFQQGEYLPAATHWREVLETATLEGLELPDPVHFNLARAFRAAGEERAARGVLEAYLAREPQGRWAERTRAELEALDGEH